MSDILSNKSQTVQEALRVAGADSAVRELNESTATAADAAQALGCKVEQIAKSLIFKTTTTRQPILVIASGGNQVNEKTLERLLLQPVSKATAEFVQEKTGFPIGGVPPVGHKERITTFIDQDLSQYDEIWAAAGTPRSVFRTTAAEIARITGGRVVSIK